MIEEIKTDNNCIVKAFENNPISILEENIDDKKIYCFKANDVAKTLDILNIRQSIQNYDEDERVVRKVYDPQGTLQDTIFLTSRGVYRLLYSSKKEIAKKFRKWTSDILDDIIFNQSKELQHQLEEQKTLVQEQKALIREKDNELQNKEKDYQIKSRLDKHKFLIDKFKSKKCIYLAEIDDDKIKIGSTNDINARKNNLKDVFGKCSFTDFFECKYYREVEQNILVTIRQHLYKEKINNHISKEVVKLSDTFNYNQLVRTVKEEIDKYEKYMFWKESNEHIVNSELLDLLKENNTILKNIQSNLIKNSTNTLPETLPINTLPPINTISPTNILQTNTTQGSRGRKIQEIDPDNLNVIKKIYPSMIYALRENNDYDKQSIQKAIKNNTVYKESRWLFVEHKQNPNIVNNIKETIENNQPEYNYIVKVNLEQTQILQFLTGIGEMRTLYKIGNNKINLILENKSTFDNAYFMRITECPKILLENYTLPIKSSKKAKSIKSTNIHNKEIKIYKSITELNIKTGITYVKIRDIIKNKRVVNECEWEYTIN
jgi:prophage antirepressor-like protein